MDVEILVPSICLHQAQKQYRPATQLFVAHIVSQQNLGQAQDVLLQAKSRAQTLKSQLNQTKILAPFSDHQGILHVQRGDVITAGTEIVALSDDRSLWVDFALPQSQVYLRQAAKHIDVFSPHDQVHQVAHWVADDGMLNPKTRQLHVRGHLNNAQHHFMPGAFVRVQLRTQADQARIFIPQYAIAYAASGPLVYRWLDKKAVPTAVVIGKRQHGLAEILSGLKDQDTIITAGRHKLFPNATIVVDNTSTQRSS